MIWIYFLEEDIWCCVGSGSYYMLGRGSNNWNIIIEDWRMVRFLNECGKIFICVLLCSEISEL